MKTVKKILLGTIVFANLNFSTVRLNAQCTTPFFSDNFHYTSSAWTQSDPIDGNGKYRKWTYPLGFPFYGAGEMLFDNYDANPCTAHTGADCGRENRIYKSLGTTLSNTSWRAEMDVKIEAGNGPSHTLIGFTAGTTTFEGTLSTCPAYNCSGLISCGTFNPSNQDGIFASLIAFGTNQLPVNYTDQPFPGVGSGWAFYGNAKNNNGPMTGGCGTFPCLNWSSGIPLPALNTWYYLRLERLNATSCKISVFSDAGRTVHVAGSPQCFTIEADIINLNTAQMGSNTSASYKRSLKGRADNINMWSGCNGLTPNFSYSISGSTSSPGNAEVRATPVAGSSNSDINAVGGGYWWKVEEVDASFNTIAGTEMENPPNWWNTLAYNDFPGYSSAVQNTSIYPPAKGIFNDGSYYRITRGVWGPCVPFTAASVVLFSDVKTAITNPELTLISTTYLTEDDFTDEEIARIKSRGIYSANNEVSSSIQIFPNPTSKDISLLIPEEFFAGYSIEITDINGKAIYSESGSNVKTKTIDLSHFSPGMYFVHVSNGTSNYYKKIIKQ